MAKNRISHRRAVSPRKTQGLGRRGARYVSFVGRESSSANKLITSAKWLRFRDKRIKRISKLRGARRVVEFTDGTQTIVHRATVHELAKLVGLVTYRDRLLNAPTKKLKREYLRRSRQRQQALLVRHMRDLEAGAAVSEPSVRARILHRLQVLRRRKFGAPILGETPATSVTPPHWGPAKTFGVLAETNVRFRTVKRRGRKYVVPMPV